MLNLLDPGNHVLDEVHIGATWRIRLNRLYAAVMRPYVKFTLTFCCYHYCYYHKQYTIAELYLQCFDAVGWATGRASGL